MNEITHLILRWLRAGGVPADGVRLVLEFPTEDAARRAELWIKREVEPLRLERARPLDFGKTETMNGLGLTLRVVQNVERKAPQLGANRDTL